MSVVDAEFTKFLATLGIGGILAAIMFLYYRKDIKSYTELWKAATNELMTVVKENTASNTKLITMIETQERNSIRKDDIQKMLHETQALRDAQQSIREQRKL